MLGPYCHPFKKINRGNRGKLGANLTPSKFWLRHFDLEPQTISEALLAAFRTLESTFGPSKTMSEPLGDQRNVFWTLDLTRLDSGLTRLDSGLTRLDSALTRLDSGLTLTAHPSPV